MQCSIYRCRQAVAEAHMSNHMSDYCLVFDQIVGDGHQDIYMYTSLQGVPDVHSCVSESAQ